MTNLTKTPRINGRLARPYVQARNPFQNHSSQLYAVQHTPTLYVVYSYGSHWPLFVHDGFDWHENEDRCSPTTSKHRTQTHPHTETIKKSCTWLRNFITSHMGYHRQLERFQRDMGLAA